MDNEGTLDVQDLFRDLIDKVSDDELTQFLERFRRLRAEMNQARPDLPQTPPSRQPSGNSSDLAAPLNPDET